MNDEVPFDGESETPFDKMDDAFFSGQGVVSSDDRGPDLPGPEEKEMVDPVDLALQKITDALSTLIDLQSSVKDEMNRVRLGVLVNVLQHEWEALLDYLNDLEITAGNRTAFVEELERDITLLKNEALKEGSKCEKLNERTAALAQVAQANGVQMEVLDAEKRRFIFVDVDGSRRIIKLPTTTDIFNPSKITMDPKEGGAYEVFGGGDDAYQLRADFASQIRRFVNDQGQPCGEGEPQEDGKKQRDRFIATLREADIPWEKVGVAYNQWFHEDISWKTLETRFRRMNKGVIF